MLAEHTMVIAAVRGVIACPVTSPCIGSSDDAGYCMRGKVPIPMPVWTVLGGSLPKSFSSESALPVTDRSASEPDGTSSERESEVLGTGVSSTALCPKTAAVEDVGNAFGGANSCAGAIMVGGGSGDNGDAVAGPGRNPDEQTAG